MRLTAPLPPAANAAAVAGLVVCGVAASFYFRAPPRSTTSLATLEQQFRHSENAYVQHLSAHCPESPVQLHRLVYAHGDQLMYS